MGYDLDGSSHGIRISGTPALLGGLSFSLWFRPHGLPGSSAWLFGEQNATASVRYGLSLLSTGQVHFNKDSSSGADAGALSVGTVTTNAWNHVYWSFNTYDTANEYQVSLNGEAIQKANFTLAGTLTTTRLGSNATGVSSRSNYFDGDIGELAIWNDVIDQVGTGGWASLVHWFSPLRVDRQYLVHYWPFRKGVRDVVGGRSLVLENGLALGSQHPPMFPAGKMRAA